MRQFVVLGRFVFDCLILCQYCEPAVFLPVGLDGGGRAAQLDGETAGTSAGLGPGHATAAAGCSRVCGDEEAEPV